MKGIGINTTLFAEIKGTNDLITESLKRIILTRPGERPNQLDFGLGLGRYLFTNMKYLSGDFIPNAINTISQYEPRIIIADLRYERVGDNSVRFTLNYKIRDQYEKDMEELVIVLSEN